MNIYFLENFNQIKSLDIIKYDTNRILFDYTLIEILIITRLRHYFLGKSSNSYSEPTSSNNSSSSSCSS